MEIEGDERRKYGREMAVRGHGEDEEDRKEIDGSL